MKPTNIKDIARALGISIGTVDRALHGRPDVSSATRTRVLKKAEQLGYRPNLAARSLKLNSRLRIGVYFPREIASFFDPLRAGVRSVASAATGVNVELVFRTFPRLDEGDVELLMAHSNEKFDGILVAPGNPDHIGPTLNVLARRGVAVVCVASDVPRSERLASVTTDAHTSGALAAEIFSRTIQKTGYLATITGELTTLDHAEKLRGFAANLAVFAPHLSLLPAIESHELPKLAYSQALALLSRKPLPLGIYISTANSIPVLRALEEKHLLNEVQIIATDLFPELVPYIESGKLLATLYQRPFAQGKAALELLLRYLLNKVPPDPVTRLAPHIIFRSNLSLFTGYMNESDERDKSEDK
ncbi:MAG TPA: LacI family DNA-binding transcriptional regulator [Terracidiphilus sp.]|jgi:LacI family transcriptional regulator, galactose operon repressor|nr:LacI family DNA-binding transcriptional regulator [Terracidiphilus sp.]